MTKLDNCNGNHMLLDREPKMNPNDYNICDVCNELNHIDEMEDGVCHWCWPELAHKFNCRNPKCEVDEFETKGVPTECPNCHFGKIEHGSIMGTAWIHEAQAEKIRQMEIELQHPQTTAAILKLNASNAS